MRQYYPKRDRGIYRAAANSASPIHDWGKKLIHGVEHNGIIGMLQWTYRKGGKFSMDHFIYSSSPYLGLIPKEDMVCRYLPIPIKTRE